MKKNKIIKILILIVIVALLILVGYTMYKYSIYQDLNQKGKESSNKYYTSENLYYKMKVNVNDNEEESYFLEYYYKDNKLKIKSTNIEGKINNEQIYDGLEEKESFILLDIGIGDFWKDWCFKSLKTENINNKENYIINVKDEDNDTDKKTTLYIDKENGIINKMESKYENNQSLAYELIDIKTNTVTDEDMEQ